MEDACLILGLSGWMDGGDVSTGTVQYLVEKYSANVLADIDSRGLYIYNVPGPMEISALFRPHARIENGLIEAFDEPENVFYCAPDKNLILFEGKEPNLHWDTFADCILEVVEQFNVSMICFAGSVSSLVPHTRDPRFHSSFSDEALRPLVEQHGLHPSNYEGPGSVVTYLMTRARDKGIRMATIVAEIPAYVHGKNIRCIEAVLRKLDAILDLSIDFSELEGLSAEFVKGLDSAVLQKKELAKHIRLIEEAYDRQEGGAPKDLRDWFDKQDIQLDL